jgi:hypothetical protein
LQFVLVRPDGSGYILAIGLYRTGLRAVAGRRKDRFGEALVATVASGCWEVLVPTPV